MGKSNSKIESENLELDYDFSKLPLIALKEIGEELEDLGEMVKFSFVCKQWKIAYDLYLKPELLCLTFNFRPVNRKLFHSNEKLKRENILKISSFEFLKSEITKKTFGDLKKLVIYHLDHYYGTPSFLGKGIDVPRANNKFRFNFKEQLNFFLNLEHLEISGDICFENEDYEIVLPKLKLLKLECIILTKAIFNTPSLEILKLDGSNETIYQEFSHPNSLKYLDYSLENDKEDLHKLSQNLIKFKNLEFLFLTKIYDVRIPGYFNLQLDNKLIDCLPNLKFIYKDTIRGAETSKPVSYDPRTLTILNISPISGSHFKKHDYDNLKNSIQYKEQLEYFPLDLVLNLRRFFEHNTSLTFLKNTYFNINSITIYDLKEQKSLTSFLKSLKYLKFLGIYKRNILNQSFFDDLPKYLTIDVFSLSDDLFLEIITDYTFLSILNAYRISIYMEHLFYSKELFLNLFKNKFIFHLATGSTSFRRLFNVNLVKKNGILQLYDSPKIKFKSPNDLFYYCESKLKIKFI